MATAEQAQSLDELLRFVELTHRFQQVRRAILVKDENRPENDLEHTGQLALLTWYIINSQRLPLNTELALKYALAHDLVEAYAQDTSAYDEAGRQTKEAREAEASSRLMTEFPEFPELHTLISQYEARKDPESRFVYALDKLLGPLNIYLDNGRSWKTEGVTLEMLLTYKAPRIAISPEIQPYFETLIEVLKEHPELFTLKPQEQPNI
ncbi:MAG: hypothetical protein A3E16_03240 [Candidatus Blackburnbacteria bacterium RIFCSPHIGHO2_12_FULL_44_25]|nr:MAG: hypothetical protein A3E16_03240 [Candidatus Blackburnbacteria bacterium RIFCSPHIGHO2_12_FULL_44_25]